MDDIHVIEEANLDGKTKRGLAKTVNKLKNMLQASGLFGMRVITEDTTFVECVGSHDVYTLTWIRYFWRQSCKYRAPTPASVDTLANMRRDV